MDDAIDFGPDGATLTQFSRRPRLFKITYGSNPYAGLEVALDETTGATTDNQGWPATVANKSLWEETGNAAVPANSIVEATPNPFGTGFYFRYGPATALDVQNTDGTQHTTAATGLKADKATGLGFTLFSSVETLAGIAASATQMGMISLGPQTLGTGSKTIQSGNLSVNDGGFLVQGYLPGQGLLNGWNGKAAADYLHCDNIGWLRGLAQGAGDASTGNLPTVATLAIVSAGRNGGSHRGLVGLLGSDERFGMVTIDTSDASARKGLPASTMTTSQAEPNAVLGTYEPGVGTTVASVFQIGGGSSMTYADLGCRPAQYAILSNGDLYLGAKFYEQYTIGANTVKKYFIGGICYRLDLNGVQQAQGASVAV